MSEQSRTKKTPASRQPTAPRIALDISDTDQNWPPDIPEKLQRHLEKKVDGFIELADARKSIVSPSVMKDEAAALSEAAKKLLHTLCVFSESHLAADFDNYRCLAVDSVREQNPDLGEVELGLFRAGMDPFLMQFPLRGLASWAAEIANIPKGKSGRRKINKEHLAVAEIIRCFKYITFDQSVDEREVLTRTCLAFLARTGNPKNSDTVSKYINTVKDKTWEKILKFSL